MSTRYARTTGSNLPSPYPEGWYFIATRRAVIKAGLMHKTWMGESIVVWSDDAGQICIAEAFCPHLGSTLGPTAGGRICEGRLVCPFHGFEYNATGQCVATPYADPPRSARLRVFETREIQGLIFAWWGIQGREPQWELPADRLDEAGWSGLEMNTLRFPGHPQETTENSVDLAHLRYVHGYEAVRRVGRISIDGHYLESRFEFARTRKIGKVGQFSMETSVRVHIFGLGYSFVEVREHSIGMDLRLWVLATPVDGTLIDLSLVSQAREIRSPRRRIVGLGFLPTRWRAPIMNKIMASFQKADVLQDVEIWSRKRYQSRPRLARSDGEIMPFRAYCAQFYPDADDAERTPHSQGLARAGER